MCCQGKKETFEGEEEKLFCRKEKKSSYSCPFQACYKQEKGFYIMLNYFTCHFTEKIVTLKKVTKCMSYDKVKSTKFNTFVLCLHIRTWK